MKQTIVLIGCSKTKKPYPFDHGKRIGQVVNEPYAVHPHEFYGGPLFNLQLDYLTRWRSVKWAVLSARMKVWHWFKARVAHDENFQPYDLTLSQLKGIHFASWHIDVAKILVDHFYPARQNNVPTKDICFEIHAGRKYAHPLAEILSACGFDVQLPLEGLQIGQRLQWYRREIDRLSKGTTDV